MIFVMAWCIVPRAGPTALAVTCVVLASSAEGAYAAWDYWSRERPLRDLRELNIDAITSWWFQTLTIDGLPRSLWNTPARDGVCVGAIALTIATHGGARVPFGQRSPPAFRWRSRSRSVLSLGGTFSLIYGRCAVWTALGATDNPSRSLRGGGFARGCGNRLVRIFRYVRRRGRYGRDRSLCSCSSSSICAFRARARSGADAGALLTGAREWAHVADRRPGDRDWCRAVPAVFRHTHARADLDRVAGRPGNPGDDPRLGRSLLCAAVGLRQRAAGAVIAALVLLAGVPTTIIDVYNAQDVTNTRWAPAFAGRWSCGRTLRPRSIGSGAHATGAVVQMSIGPGRRERGR